MLSDIPQEPGWALSWMKQRWKNTLAVKFYNVVAQFTADN